ncbi:nuclear transport factor 2 family protein [Paraburkholderia sediminicola]|jgi:ketosteroid isomerase-like protein|uniref:nuclear transport factor 2 family protein n=1 Tax=Paraburkholderia sediminicola TaxID=458836 RepID=UPI0038BB32A9
MKRTAILTTAALMLASVATYSYAATPDEAALVALEQSWAKAASTHDVAVLDKVLDDSYVEVTANGTRRGKADALAAPGLAPGASQSLSEVQATVNGDIAVVSGVNYYSSGPGALAVKFVFTDIYAKRPDGWRAISSHMARRPM